MTGNPWIGLLNSSLAPTTSRLTQGAKPTVLITTNWGDKNLRHCLPDEVFEFVRDFVTDYNFIFRLHPNTIKGFAEDERSRFLQGLRRFGLDELGFSENKVLEDSLIPLPNCLSIVSAHLTWSSSVAIEAAIYGVKTIMLTPMIRNPGNMYYTALIESGDIVSCPPASLTQKILDQCIERRSLKPIDGQSQILRLNRLISQISNS